MDKEKAVKALELLLNEAVKKGVFGDAKSVAYTLEALEFVKALGPPQIDTIT